MKDNADCFLDSNVSTIIGEVRQFIIQHFLICN